MIERSPTGPAAVANRLAAGSAAADIDPTLSEAGFALAFRTSQGGGGHASHRPAQDGRRPTSLALATEPPSTLRGPGEGGSRSAEAAGSGDAAAKAGSKPQDEPDARRVAAHTTVDICVCTYRRPYLAETLRSLAGLTLPPATTARIIVADNDATPSARALVETLRPTLPFAIDYRHCPESNISLARNACLDAAEGDFLAFIDDDSTATPDWLKALLECAQASRADVVLGPVCAVYGETAPAWMRQGDFHSTGPVWVDGEIRTGYSGNVLLDRRSAHVAGRRFDLRLGQTGGEDTRYFQELHQSGGRIAYAPQATMFEPVSPERARFAWLAKRRFRSGQTHGRLLAAQTSRLPQAGLASAKAAICLAAAIAHAASPQRRNRELLRGVLHVGAVSGLFGMNEIRLYGPGKEAPNAA